MNITVILCTYNRCQSLANALESVAASILPESIEWEILVVDNNSKDQTRDMVMDYSARYPGRFRYLFEAQPGKSYALNCGIREAYGQILAFMDDDVTVEPTWLANLTIFSSDPTLAGSGGRIEPQWSFPPPAWLPRSGRHPLAPLALFDLGPTAGPLLEPPFGTNMAFRKEIFEKYGGFRTDLGPVPGSEIRGEDSEFGSRLLTAGERLRYEPSAIVYHPVTPNRLDKNYFLTWWYDKGRTIERMAEPNQSVKQRLDRVSLRLSFKLANWAVRWIFTIGQSRRFANKISFYYVAGQVRERYVIKRAQRRSA